MGSPADMTKSEPLVPIENVCKVTVPSIFRFPLRAFILKDLSFKSLANSVFKSPLRTMVVPAVTSAKMVVELMTLISGLAALKPSIP